MKTFRFVIPLVAAAAIFCGSLPVTIAQSSQPAQQQTPAAGTASIASILTAHKAWTSIPGSIQIMGTSLHGTVTEPVTIIATRQEENITEYASRTVVMTPYANFEQTGSKVTRNPVVPGFNQLDITSLFLLAQMSQRPITAGAAIAALSPAGAGLKIHVEGGRSQVDYGKLPVSDEADVFIGPDGMLAGISRSFYPSSNLFHYTLSYAFSDYRDTGGTLLPYRIDKYLKGQNIESITVDSYSIDVPTSPTLFQPKGN